MNRTLWALLFALQIPALAACNGKSADAEDAGGGDKAVLEATAALLTQPVALIAAYEPYLVPPEEKDPYAPKRRSDLQKAGAAASGEIRFAANGARQKMNTSTPATKDLEAALADISKTCTEATDSEAYAKCDGSVKALDASLGKAAAAATAAGASAKFPRVAPEAITEEAKKAVAPFLKALKPGPAELAYFAKRSDEKASVSDVAAACQTAVDEMTKVSAGYAQADEPLRLVAVTHKLSLDSQLRVLNETDSLQKDLGDCKKKAKSTECKVVCAKVRTKIDDGLPAAAFASLPKDADAICGK
jgi:hypothetical protein